MLAGRCPVRQLSAIPNRRSSLNPRLALVALALAAAPVAAQTPATVLLAPGSARALALGDAFVLGSPDTDGIFYNAAASGSAGLAAGVGVYDDARLLGASAATTWLGATVMLGLRTSGPAASVTDTELAGAVRAEALGVRFAVTAKTLERRTGDARAGVVAADLALAADAGPIRLGLAARDLGADVDNDNAALEMELPTRLVLSAATRSLPVGPFDLTAAGRAGADRDRDVAVGGGLELAYWPIQGRTFAARAGALREAGGRTTWTAGGGFAGDRMAIDYAFHDAGEGAHRITLRWR